jgi:exonuclease VII small subunit
MENVMELKTSNAATHRPPPPQRRPYEMTVEEIRTQVQAIIAGKLSGEGAVETLRQAVQQCHADEDALAERRGAIEKAEAILIYGFAGRPARQYGSCFGVSSPD